MNDKPFRDHVVYPIVAALIVAVILAVSNYFGYSAAQILGFENRNVVQYLKRSFEEEQALMGLDEKRIIYCPKEMVPVSCTALKYPSGIGQCGTTMFNGSEKESELIKYQSKILGETSIPRCIVNECGSPGEGQYWGVTVSCGKFTPRS